MSKPEMTRANSDIIEEYNNEINIERDIGKGLTSNDDAWSE